MAKRVLIVDYEETVREIVAAMLVAAGYDCRMAASGVEALALLEREKFDLMLTNLMMPAMDGFELMERTLKRYPNMPVVFETAVNDIWVAIQVMLAGARDYVLQPLDQERILSAVHRALETPGLKGEHDTDHADLDARIEAGHNDAFSNPEKSYESTLEVLGNALDRSEAVPEGCSRRVTAYTIVLARKMGLPKERIGIIARGAFLHDIGKMIVPDHILRKPGELTPDEVKIMQQHCYSGYKMVSRVPFLAAEVAEIVYSHHERYDGSGYPRELKGEEIPLGARLVAVAETFDSLTSGLPYCEGRLFTAAREEIERWSGRFDPEIIKTFLAVPDYVWEKLRRNIDPQA
jgi:putative nucleotidyltransferase with HDIG domain